MTFSQFEYLIANLLVIVPTLALTLMHPKNLLRAKLKSVIIAISICAVIFLIWDVYATAAGHWQFNKEFLLGWSFLGLPFEEYLFFITVPFSCLFVWDEFKNFESWDSFFDKLRGR